MVRNVMKHTLHKWGVHILSIHKGIGPPLLSSQLKNENFHEKIICQKILKCKININFFSSFLGILTFGEGGGGRPGWVDKLPLCSDQIARLIYVAITCCDLIKSNQNFVKASAQRLAGSKEQRRRKMARNKCYINNSTNQYYIQKFCGSIGFRIN